VLKFKLGRISIIFRKNMRLHFMVFVTSITPTTIHRIDSAQIFKRLSEEDQVKLEHESDIYTDYKKLIITVITLFILFILPVILLQWLRLFKLVREMFFKK